MTGTDQFVDTTYRTLGELSDHGRDRLLVKLDQDIKEADDLIAARMAKIEQDPASVDLQQYEQDLRHITHRDLLRARRDLVSEGVYITLPMSGNTAESVPPDPKGVISATYGLYEVESGELAQVRIWVDADKRPNLREARKALVHALTARRDQWIQSFMSASIDTRRAWFERYEQLSKKHSEDAAAMSGQDVAEWIALMGEIEHLSLELAPASYTVY